jgi:hypothetical protein
MAVLVPSFSITIDDAQSELHFVALGRWDREKLKAFNWELLRKTRVFTGHKRGFRVFGDLREFGVQDREITDLMRHSLEGSFSLGVERMAVVYVSELVSMQFKQVSADVDLQTFDNELEALAWLRS